jgi:hypothetical protein
VNDNRVPVAQFDLDALMRQILTVDQLVTEVALCLASGTPEALATAARLIEQTKESTITTLERLQRLGGTTGYRPPPEPVPPHLADTSATRRLYVLLTEAQAAAEVVDAERGRAIAGAGEGTPPSGRSSGFDLAESLSELRLRVQHTNVVPTASNSAYGAEEVPSDTFPSAPFPSKGRE